MSSAVTFFCFAIFTGRKGDCDHKFLNAQIVPKHFLDDKSFKNVLFLQIYRLEKNWLVAPPSPVSVSVIAGPYPLVTGGIVHWAFEYEVVYGFLGGDDIVGYEAGLTHVWGNFLDFVEEIIEWEVAASNLENGTGFLMG